MAGILFNGSTSKLEHISASGFSATAITVLAWMRADGAGGGSAGRAFTCSEVGPATEGFMFSHRATADTPSFHQVWSGSTGTLASWNFTATDSAWHAVAVSYDRSTTTNDPIVRVDFASVTPSETSAPVGTVTPPVTGYCIGNNTGQTRGWQGGLMHLQFHPTALSAANMDKALKYPGSVKTEQAVWWPLLDGTYTRTFVCSSGVWINHTNQPTATALAAYTTASPAGPRRRRFLAGAGRVCG